MDLQSLSLDALNGRTVAVLGYGNQGRAHALNLRDSGVRVVVGSRTPGLREGFETMPFAEAARLADVVMFLLPDQAIPAVYGAVQAHLEGKFVGFAHGFAYHFGFLPPIAGAKYFLVSPKGAGALLRANFENGGGLPGVFAAKEPETRAVALAYAKAIGLATSVLLETTFQEETECDLFGEQTVLCGGILQLMESAFEILVKNGYSREMAFFECCYEARLILELWMKFGPSGLSERISPTAFFGGLTRGRRLITEDTKREMEKMFLEVRDGSFAKEWMSEVEAGMPRLEQERARLADSALQEVYSRLKPRLNL